MVTRIGQGRRKARRLFLEEWMEAKDITPEALGLRFDPPVSRTTVWRWIREPHRLNPEKMAAFAEALGIQPEDLWRSPNRPSVDALLANSSDDLYRTALDIVARLTNKAS